MWLDSNGEYESRGNERGPDGKNLTVMRSQLTFVLVRDDATFLLELGVRDWRGSNVPQLPCCADAVGVTGPQLVG